MQYEEFTILLKNQIPLMSHSRQLNFCLKICKELFFDYQNFYEAEKWGNPDLLLDAINLYEKIMLGSAGKEKAKDFLPGIDSITPDMDDFGSELSSCALNACTAISEALEFLIDGNEVHINNIATYYSDTAFFRIDEQNILTTEEIDNHPLVIKARKFLIEETS